MGTNQHTYSHPLIERYSSPEMIRLFSPHTKITTWRKLWIALAEAEKELGLEITDNQIEEMRANIDLIDLERAAEIEKEASTNCDQHKIVGLATDLMRSCGLDLAELAKVE